MVRSAVDERARDGEVFVGGGDVPGDDVADVVEVGLWVEIEFVNSLLFVAGGGGGWEERWRKKGKEKEGEGERTKG